MTTTDAKPSLMPIPTDNAARWEWIKYQLRLRGSSLSAIARELGVVRKAPQSVKRLNYPRMQLAIATVLGLHPADIWPERYMRGRRKYSQDHNTRARRHNGKAASGG
jgi:Ner family transcriptional regulator